MNGKILGIIVVVAVVLGLGFFLVKDQVVNTTPSPSVKPTPEVTTDNVVTSTPSKGSPTVTQTEETMITLTSSGFSPASLTVKVGTKVNFINNSGSSATVDSNPHPVHTSFAPLNLGAFKDSGTLSITFDKAGTYGYHNHLNATQKGMIIADN